jgi:hypothetical protein
MLAVTWTALGILAAAFTGVLAAVFHLGSRIDALGARLDARIDALDRKVDTRTDALDRKLDVHLEWHRRGIS